MPVGKTLVWQNLSPDGGDRPEGALADAITEHHGGFDAWEHAYDLQYRNVRPDYVTRLWDVVNWQDVSARYAAASA